SWRQWIHNDGSNSRRAASSAQCPTRARQHSDRRQRYREGSDEAGYRHRLEQIYQTINELGVPAARVLANSIPDFSPLPGAAPFGSPSNLRARVDAFNAIARTEANLAGFQYADITEISREASRGHDWLAADGLHPGPTQHRAFADHLWEAVDPTWPSIRR